MPSLTVCLQKVGAKLDPADKAAVMARSRELRMLAKERGETMSATDAARQAAKDVIAEIRAALKAAEPKVPTQHRAAHPKTVMGSELLALVSARLGGLDPSLISEFSVNVPTGKFYKNGVERTEWRNPMIGGIGKLFRRGGRQDRQEIAQVLEDADYLEPGAVANDYKEAGERAKDLIKAALDRNIPKTLAEQQAEMEAGLEADRQAYYDALDEESAREADAERAAIMAEAELSRVETQAVDEEDLFNMAGGLTGADAMRAMGFSEQEIADELAREAKPQGQAAQASAAQDAEAALGPAPEAGPAGVDAAQRGPEQAAEGLARNSPNSSSAGFFGNVNSKKNESVPDVGEVGPNSLADLLESQAFLAQGLGALQIPAQRSVLSQVVGLLHNPEVRKSVVQLVPVDVVDFLAGQQGAAKRLLNDPSVLQHMLSVDANLSVPIFVDGASRVALIAALHAAKRASVSSEFRRLANKFGPAIHARNKDASPARSAAAGAAAVEQPAIGVGKLSVGPVEAGGTVSATDVRHGGGTNESGVSVNDRPADAPSPFASNKIFTQSDVDAARALLKKKLGQINSGIDPELMQAGITIAGAYIESGVRKFADFARVMVDDLGERVKPYLQSWYMALRMDPRSAAFRDEMDKASTVEDLDVDAVLAAPKAVPAPAPAAPATPGKIEDFGEKLIGARKDYAATMKDAMDVDVAAEPLSKSWPEPDYDKLLAGGADPFMVAFIRAARDEIPTKPQKSWKLKGWVEGVKSMRETARSLLSGEVAPDKARVIAGKTGPAMRTVLSRAELYELVGHARSLKGISFAENHYGLYKGQENVRKWVVEQQAKATMFSNWPRELAVADTKAEMLEQFKARIDSLDLGRDPKKQAQFVIYSKRGQKGAWVGKKIGREYIDLHKADDVAAARKYMAENQAALEAALEKYKETPFERKTENQPRVGEDHRNGAPVTPEVFADTFGFRGVQFGNYVEQGRRQSDLNEAFDALMDLAAVLGVQPRALSLNGKLGLAFGARGRGGKEAPAAHFEPDNVVINLTKGGGPGSLAHEWWHSLDNYFARMSGDNAGFVTGGAKADAIRAAMRLAFRSVQTATQAPTLRQRAAELDKRKSKPYWNTPLELSARAFESYVIAKLQDQNAANDYLANVVDAKVWNVSEQIRAAFFGGDSKADTYPYPLPAELPAVRAAFDDFFKTVEQKADDAGNIALLSQGRGRGIPLSTLKPHIDAITAKMPGLRAAVEVVGTVTDLPKGIVDSLRSMNALGTVRGLRMPDGRVFLVADKLDSQLEAEFVLFHEVYGHEGLRAILTGDEYARAMTLVRLSNKAVAAEADRWTAAYGADQIEARIQNGMTPEAARREVRLLAIEEALADRAGKNDAPSVWKNVMAAIQKALRRMGMNDLANWLENRTEAETYALLMQARKAITSPKKVHAFTPATSPLFQRVWHGTPHEFDKFDTSAIGTGEGAQAYGYGMYFASRREVAEHYRKALSRRGVVRVAGKELAEQHGMFAAQIRNIADAMDDGVSFEDARQQAVGDMQFRESLSRRNGYADDEKEAAAAVASLKALTTNNWTTKSGQLLEVEIPEDGEMLLWDRPLSEQPVKVRKAMEGGKIPNLSGQNILEMDPSGEALYRSIGRWLAKPVDEYASVDGAPRGWGAVVNTINDSASNEKAASNWLAEFGIKGIKYLDGVSRNKPLRDVKREFLAELPEDAGFDEVMELIGTGTFSPKNEAVLRALADNDWLGFDYPAQAISTALSSQLANFDPSPELVQAVAATQDDSTYNYVIFSGDDVAIQQALLSRRPPPLAPAITVLPDENGNPTFRGATVKLDYPQPAERFEFIPGPGQQLLNYAIMPTEGFDSLGFVELVVENGQVTALMDIEINGAGRRAGVGSKVIETILAANPDADVNISNIVHQARGFWDKMGVPEQNLEDGAAYDGTLNWQTYAQATNDGRAARMGQEEQGAVRRDDRGAAQGDRAAGRGAQAPVLSQRSPGTPAPIATAAQQSLPAQRQPLPASWRDPTNRLQFAPGAWLYGALGRLAAPLLIKMQFKAATPEMRRQLRQMKLDVQKAQDVAVAVAGETTKLSEAEREMVSDIIEREVAAGTVPPAHAVRLAAMMNQAMGQQSRDLIDLEMLTPEAAARWDGAYLPRFYESKLKKQVGDAWADAVKRLTGRTSAMRGVKGSHLKSRGIFEPVIAQELEKWEQMGWEIRDPDYPAGTTAADLAARMTAGLLQPDEKVQMWRDFTRVERDNMGEIRDSGFRFVMGYMQTQRDIALGRMFKRMAEDPASSSRIPQDGWVRVPDSTIEGTGAKRYGKLSGRYVPKETLSHLSQIEESQSAAWQMYRQGMAIWKMGKTAMNPVSHMNNVLSNLTMAHFAGVGYHRADKYVAAIKDFATGAPAVKEARDAGLFLGTMSDAELMNTLPKELQELAGKAESKTVRGAKLVFDLMTFFLRKPMGAAYQAEDTFFRYLIYKDARGRGLSPDDAIDYAQKYIFTYDDLPKGARYVRDFGIPFFAYTYKAVPALLSTALTHPVRFAAPAAVLWAANAMAYAIAAGDDDDTWAEILSKYLNDEDFRKKVREQEKLERENLPPWMKGTTALSTPKAIRLGMDEVTKLPLFIDVARIIPGGDIFDVSPNAGGIPLPQPITPSHPLFSIATGMIANKDLWTGKDLVDKNDTRGEAAEKRSEWMWKQISPAMAIGNYHWERGMNALAQASGGEIKWLPEFIAEDYTGMGRDRLPVQPGLAAMQTFGIKVRPIDIDKSIQMEGTMREKMIRDITAEYRTLTRLNQAGVISDTRLEKERAKTEVKVQRLREGLTVDGDERP